MSALAFCTATATTKRSPAAVGGRVGEMQTHLTTLAIMPLMPVGSDLTTLPALTSPREAKETYCPEADVREGDRLVVAGTEYVIRWVGEWPWFDEEENFLRLAVEEIK